MKSLKLIYIIYITICFIISLAVFNSIAFAASNTAEPLVKTVTVTLDNVNPPEKFIGHVEAIESVKLIARVTGYLEKVNFKEGSIVKKGSLLYVIEQPPYLAKVSANKALVKQAKADLFKANQKLNRLLSAQPESVPATDLDDAKAQKDYTEGVLNENQANLKLSLIDFDYTTITAPLTGRIGKTMYTEGNFVGPTSEPLAEIVQMDPIRVVFSVSENNIDFIEKSLADAEKSKTQSIISPEITFPDGIKYDLKGSIDFVDNKVDPQTGTIAIWSEFRNPEGRLIPGEYVTVYLALTSPKLMPVVPQVAVMQDNEGQFVYIVNKESKVETRRIEAGSIVGDKLAVKTGLNKGDIIIIEGIQKVKPGLKVKATPEDVEAH